ncbi:MAG: hypothetical protein AB7I13_15840 [Vicinamibacterales bacterium]
MSDPQVHIDALSRRMDRVEDDLRRSTWVAPLYGHLPQVPQRETLPTASADFAYRLIVIPDVPDELYICVRDNAGAWEWILVATGTP